MVVGEDRAMAVRGWEGGGQGPGAGGPNAKGLENQWKAAERAERLRPVLVELSGMSARTAAYELNRRPGPAGGKWFATQVNRARERLSAKG
jgi:hypothetical protein